MRHTPPKNISLPVANKSPHCLKAKCQRSLPIYHPTSYTNGLCERHFFAIDLSPNDDDDDENTHWGNETKLLAKEKKLHSIKHQDQPLRDDIRKTHEIFDGRQWRVIQQTTDHGSTTIKDNNLNIMTTKTNDNEGHLLQIFRLLSGCQMIQDELKKQEQQNN